MSEARPKDKGSETEDIIESISRVMFLRDFVVRNPKFRKQNGQEKEVTDILVPFESDLISIQAKSKIVNTSTTKSEVIDQRIQKIIDNAVGQLANTKRIVDEGKTVHFKNAHGIDIPISAKNVTSIHGLVIVNIYDQNNSHIRIKSAYVNKNGIPAHILDAVDFYAISSEIDTIPDLIEYLYIRALLFESNKINEDAMELDLLAVYKTNPDNIQTVIDNENGHLVILSGIWDEYQSGRASEIKERNRLNLSSRLIDSTIEQMSGVIGYAPDAKNPSTGLPMDPGDIKGYWAGIYELSKLGRLQRRFFGNKMHEKLAQADRQGFGYTVYMTNEHEAILFFSSKTEVRQERIDQLFNLASMAYVSKNLTKIVAIATEPLSGPGRSLDVILLDGVSFVNSEDLRKQSKQFFSEPKNITGYEYGG